MGSCTNSLVSNSTCLNSDRCQNNNKSGCCPEDDSWDKRSDKEKARQNKTFANSQATSNENTEEPMVMPSTLQTKKKKADKKKSVIKNTKVINVQQGEEEPMIMPSTVVNAESLGGPGLSSSSMIKTSDEDPLKKLRKCGSDENEYEAPMPVPKVVSAPKKDEKRLYG